MSKDIYMLCDVNGNTEKRPVPTGGGVIEIDATVTVDQGTGKQTVTTNIIADDLFTMINSGKQVCFLATLTFSDGGEPVTVHSTNAWSVHAKKFVFGSDTLFEFSFTDIDSEKGVQCFIASDLSADDIVVFHEV